MNTIKSVKYRQDIDGLRAISIICVVIFHGYGELLPGGFVGVDVFFVISGYLITGQIYSKLDHYKFSFIDFYTRRIKRILPPLILVMSVCLIHAWFNFSLNNYESINKHVAAGAGFVSNLLLWNESGYFDKQSELKPLLHLWSLGVEEQFYIVWPALIFLAYKLSKKGLGTPLLMVLLICIISFAFNLIQTEKSQIASFYSPLTRLWELGIGGVMALTESSRIGLFAKQPRYVFKHWVRNFSSVVGLLLLLVASLMLSKNDAFPGVLALIPVAGACLIIAAGPSAMINQYILSNQVMVFIGLISYSVYLWHWPLLSFAYIHLNTEPTNIQRVVIIIASIALGYVTWAGVECPIRQLKHRMVSIFLLGALLILGFYGYFGYTNKILPERLIPQLMKQARVFDSSGIPLKDCSSIMDPKSLASKYCRIWGNDSAKETIVIWGDSLAKAWMPVFLTLQRNSDFRIVQISHAACPPILDVHRTGKSFASSWCNDSALQSQIFEAVKKVSPAKVFLIARWNLYMHGHIKNGKLVEMSFITDGTEPATDLTAKQAFENKLPFTLKKLGAFSHVIIFKGTPVLKVPLDIGMYSMPLTYEPQTLEFRRFESAINEIIDRAASENIKSFDASYLLCNDVKCPAFIRGVPVYSDEVHITAAATLLFKRDIQKMILEQ